MRSILVPLDGSPFSEQAIPAASGIAKRNNASLNLVVVHQLFLPPPTWPGDAADKPRQERQWRSSHGAYVRDLVARVEAATSVPVTGDVVEGPIVPALVHAASAGTDLIVLATHGEAGRNRLWLGSVARALTHRAPVPVLLIKPDSPSFEARRERFRTVLVPVDGSELSETAIEHALLVAGTTGVRYVLFRVVTPLEDLELGRGPWTSTERLAETEAREYLERRVKELRARGIDAMGESITARRSAPAILAAARKYDADLIAVTTHSRTAASRLLRRSVADGLARASGIASLVGRKYAPTVGHPAAETEHAQHAGV